MKAIVRILLCLALFSIIACGGANPFDSQLRHLDSLLIEHPDSVYQVLEGMEKESRGQSESSRMYYALLRADAQNKAYIDFTTDSVMQQVADYYDLHGTANEQMRAHYLLGCTYRDLNDAPMELQSFQEATEKADTTQKDCDLYTLVAIYGQMADLYHSQYLPEEELKALDDCEHISMMNSDTITAISAYELRARAYFFMNEADSVLSITDKAHQAFLAIGDKSRAARMLGTAISIYIDRGDYENASIYMKEFEENSGYFDNEGNIIKSRNIYYHDKGRMALHHNNIDSAKYYFDKLIPDHKEMAYEGLLTLFEKTGQYDSIARYSHLYAISNDSSFLNNNAQTIVQMTAMYNYGHQKYIAELRERETVNVRQKLYMYIGVSIFIFLVITFSAFRIKQTKDNKIIEMTRFYFDILSQKEVLEKEIKELASSNKNLVEQNRKQLKQKEKEMIALQHLVDYYSGKLELDDFDKRLNAFKKTNIYTRIRQSILFKEVVNKLTESEWEKYDSLFEQYFPKYFKCINTNSLLNHDERRVCLLIILGFSPKELSAILNKTMPRISNIRASINKKLFNTGSATLLNENLKRLF